MIDIQKGITRVVERFLKFPTVQSVVVSRHPDRTELVTNWSQTAPETSETIKFERQFVLSPNGTAIGSSPHYLGNSHVFYAPSLKRKVLFRPKKDGKAGEYVLDLWAHDRFENCIDLAAAKLHGSPYFSGDLASFDWRHDEKQFLFVAERKRPTTSSFFDRWSASDAVAGGESRWYEDWGEQMDGQHETVVVVVDVVSASLRVLGWKEGFTLAQAVWLSDSIYAVAYRCAPKRLGIIYCTSRPNVLVHCDLQADTFSPVSGVNDTDFSYRSLRASTDQKYLVFLERDAYGPHHDASRLVRFRSENKERKVLVDTVEDPIDSDGFAGIYCLSLPRQCFPSSDRLCFSTQQGTRWVSYGVNIITGQRSKLDDVNFQILAVGDDTVCGVRSSLLTPHQLVVCSGVDVFVLDESQAAVRGSVTHQVYRRPVPEELSSIPYTALLATPEGSGPFPLIVFPHGGPHSVLVDEWSVHVGVLIAAGMMVLAVNYRGSTGAGSRSLHALPGRVGCLDVGDVKHALQQTLTDTRCDGDRVGVYGGSHGGFLSTHLSSHLPQLIGAVVARNPVCNIATMTEASDIPDWTFVETGERYTGGEVATAKQLSHMLSCSPLSGVDRVRAPTLLLVGSGDRRVPASQAFDYRQALVSRGVETQLRVYEDCHSLMKPAVIGDVLVHTVLWMCQHLKYSPNSLIQ